MAGIELVIRISQEDYEAIKDNSIVGDMTIPYIFEAIRNGVQIPEGHGDLIDRNELKKVYDERITYLYALNKKDNSSRGAKICATNWCANTIDELPTIIEADYAGLEEKHLGNSEDKTGIYADYEEPKTVSMT